MVLREALLKVELDRIREPLRSIMRVINSECTSGAMRSVTQTVELMSGGSDPSSTANELKNVVQTSRNKRRKQYE